MDCHRGESTAMIMDEEGSSSRGSNRATTQQDAFRTQSVSAQDEEWGDFFASVHDDDTGSDGETDTTIVSEGKHVAFHGCVTVAECLHHLEYSKREFKNTWYSERDMEKNKESIRKAIRQYMLAAGSLSSSKEICFRGLEHKVPICAKKRQRNKTDGWNAVYSEQLYQWENGLNDPESIADVYVEATKHCVDNAIHLGNIDRQAVLDDDHEQLLSNSGRSQRSVKGILFKNKDGTARTPLANVQAFGPLSRAA